jgi:hypothetical protein
MGEKSSTGPTLKQTVPSIVKLPALFKEVIYRCPEKLSDEDKTVKEQFTLAGISFGEAITAHNRQFALCVGE